MNNPDSQKSVFHFNDQDDMIGQAISYIKRFEKITDTDVLRLFIDDYKHGQSAVEAIRELGG